MANKAIYMTGRRRSDYGQSIRVSREMKGEAMKHKNPQDSTLRNVRAANARIDRLDRRLIKIEASPIFMSERELRTLKQRFTHMENVLHELFAGFEAAQRIRPQKGFKR